MKVLKWIRDKSQRFFNSIALIPSVVVIVFLLLSAGMILLDYSDFGKNIKAKLNWIRLKDASTARSTVSVIAAGLISITVFSFSMVMVVLNQAASQLSNRVIDRLIGNKLQQFILGFYIGTIIYSLLLLSSIRDIETGIYVPALSTYLLIFLSVVAIFLFVFFLHFITQSIKYSVIIHRVFSETRDTLEKSCQLSDEPEIIFPCDGEPFTAHRSGIFESFDGKKLIPLLAENDCILSFRFSQGQFLLQDSPLFDLTCKTGPIPTGLYEKISEHVMIVDEESVEFNFYFGFRQLTEVAIKALSPGINDPGTAVESIRALIKLLAYRLKHFQDNGLRDAEHNIRIITKEKPFDEIFRTTLLPVWDYGCKDRLIQNELKGLLQQLQGVKYNNQVEKLLTKVLKEIGEN